ncbi:hypothetical protein LTR95_003469 [Oleoguttula sp. CCFEE 5521]
MGIRVKVLVSHSNEHALRIAYNKETSMALYMSVALRVLRQMAMDAKGDAFKYPRFKNALKNENLTKEQTGPLSLRLELLESFLDLSTAKSKGAPRRLVDLEPGTLTIFDITDPLRDVPTACMLFDICLSMLEECRPSRGLLTALDEAHKYMTTLLAATNFTEKLLGIIREQRRNEHARDDVQHWKDWLSNGMYGNETGGLSEAFQKDIRLSLSPEQIRNRERRFSAQLEGTRPVTVISSRKVGIICPLR